MQETQTIDNIQSSKYSIQEAGLKRSRRNRQQTIYRVQDTIPIAIPTRCRAKNK